jgi:hypothetical protein
MAWLSWGFSMSGFDGLGERLCGVYEGRLVGFVDLPVAVEGLGDRLQQVGEAIVVNVKTHPPLLTRLPFQVDVNALVVCRHIQAAVAAERTDLEFLRKVYRYLRLVRDGVFHLGPPDRSFPDTENARVSYADSE